MNLPRAPNQEECSAKLGCSASLPSTPLQMITVLICWWFVDDLSMICWWSVDDSLMVCWKSHALSNIRLLYTLRCSRQARGSAQSLVLKEFRIQISICPVLQQEKCHIILHILWTFGSVTEFLALNSLLVGNQRTVYEKFNGAPA